MNRYRNIAGRPPVNLHINIFKKCVETNTKSLRARTQNFNELVDTYRMLAPYPESPSSVFYFPILFGSEVTVNQKTQQTQQTKELDEVLDLGIYVSGELNVLQNLIFLPNSISGHGRKIHSEELTVSFHHKNVNETCYHKTNYTVSLPPNLMYSHTDCVGHLVVIDTICRNKYPLLVEVNISEGEPVVCDCTSNDELNKESNNDNETKAIEEWAASKG